MKELPEGWEEVELLRYLELVKSGVNKFSELKKYIATGSLETGKIIDFIEIDYETRPSRANMEVQLNDVLFAKMKDTEKVFLVSENEKEYIFSTGFSILRVKNHEKVFPAYIFYWLKSSNFQKKKNEECSGATQKAINETRFKNFKLILPPLPTQKKITTTLEKAEKLRGWRKEADGLTDKFLKSTFLEMFGDPVKNQKGWKVVKFGDLWSHYRHGYAGRNNIGNPSGTLILRIRNVLRDRIVYEKLDREEIASEYIPKYTLGKGDLLMVRVNGSPEEIGRSVIFSGFDEVVIHDDNIIRIVLNSASVLPEYIQALLKSTYVRSKIADTCKSTAGQYLLSKTMLFEIDVPCPPIHLQQKFASIVQQIEQVRQHQKQSKQQIDHFFNVIMQRAFHGELEV